MKLARFVATALAAIVFLVSPTYAADGYTVEPGQTRQITEHGICKMVTNTADTPLFVPTKGFDEWANFRTVRPFSVVEECVACEGYARDGYCFYAGHATVYQTCNEVCSSHGGINAAGMDRLISRTNLADATPVTGGNSLWGGQVQFAGGGGAPIPPGVDAPGKVFYCQRIIEAMLGHPSSSTAQLADSGYGYGCALITMKGTLRGAYIDSSWNPNSAGDEYCTGSRPICACNR